MDISKNFYDVIVPNVLNRIDQFLNIINNSVFPNQANAEKQLFTVDFDYRKSANQVRMFIFYFFQKKKYILLYFYKYFVVSKLLGLNYEQKIMSSVFKIVIYLSPENMLSFIVILDLLL